MGNCALIIQYGLQNSIELVGWASSAAVQQQILQARALVLPSFAEGLPVVLMEALALGRPVISTYVAGIPELVDPNVCGWLIPPGSIEALTTAMRNALTCSVETLEQMGKAGAQRVAQQWDATKEASKLAILFQRAVKSQAVNPNEFSILQTPNP
jgi:colanic acid/amylovoran biosynthesis glycosyltransferase